MVLCSLGSVGGLAASPTSTQQMPLAPPTRLVTTSDLGNGWSKARVIEVASEAAALEVRLSHRQGPGYLVLLDSGVDSKRREKP